MTESSVYDTNESQKDKHVHDQHDGHDHSNIWSLFHGDSLVIVINM
jgi:hypothetical protein